MINKTMNEQMVESRLEQIGATLNSLRATRSAHNIAMERKKLWRRTIGLTSMICSLLVTSGLVELLLPGIGETVSREAQTTIKLLTFLAAVLTAAVTEFGFEKEAEMHQQALQVYASLVHKADWLMASLKDGNVADVEAERAKIQKEYENANKAFMGCTPSNRDFKLARRGLAELGAKHGAAIEKLR